VNFTSDLSDTLAEVKHLERLGFTVPDVARNMSLQVNVILSRAYNNITTHNGYFTGEQINRCSGRFAVHGGQVRRRCLLLGPGRDGANDVRHRNCSSRIALGTFTVQCMIRYKRGKGRDGTGRDGTGMDGTGRDETGRDGTGRTKRAKGLPLT
jgi:hypothetical protein